MSVDTFDPGALNAPMDETAVAELCRVAEAFDGEHLELSELEVRRFAPLVTHEAWCNRAEALTDAAIVALIRVLTIGERDYSSWLAGDKSAVIVLVRALKSRGAFTPELSRWIKAHTDNKFLPHGSLMDRL